VNARATLRAALERYAARTPEQGALVEEFIAFLVSEPRCFERTLASGHFTASAWLSNRAGTEVLLTHHRKLGRWLQLGGHADGDPDLAAVALREAEEESGLSDLRIVPEIFDLDRHRIPARPGEPEHWHWDVRYRVQAQGSESIRVGAESFALAWVPLEQVRDDPAIEPSLRRMAAKSLALG
jgi:8-oxo-dGTP pyrophosphatase MutT (NUDIX family)